jgi:hypothetical protein
MVFIDISFANKTIALKSSCGAKRPLESGTASRTSEKSIEHVKPASVPFFNGCSLPVAQAEFSTHAYVGRASAQLYGTKINPP